MKSAGFTLTEILLGFVLVAVMLAFAIPNFIKIQMRLNMGLVEQHLRVIGEQMTELIKRDRAFPEDIAQLGRSGQEGIITSSLETIRDEKGYEIEGFQTSTRKTSYLLRVCPKKGKWGLAGDQCFILDPQGVRTLNPWDGTGLAMNLFAKNVKEEVEITSGFSGILTPFLANQHLSDKEKTDLLTNLFEKTAYRLDLKRRQIQNAACPPPETEACTRIKLTDAPASTLFYLPRHLSTAYYRLIPDVYQKLRAKGVYLYQQEISPEQIARNNKNTQWSLEGELPASYLANRPEMKAIEVGFRLKNPVETDEELRQRSRRVGKTVEDWLFS